jgi:hypothetical protein
MLAREETRTGLPRDMKPGERYEDVAVDKRLMGRVDVREDRPPASRKRSQLSGRLTKEQLYAQAKRLNIQCRSTMTKRQLERAVRRARP